MNTLAPTSFLRPVMLLAGGTGGHIFPALAVAAVLRQRGIPVRWLGADGAMETRLVPKHGIELDTLPISGLRGKGWRTRFTTPIRLIRAVWIAGQLLRRHKPRVVIAFGGFASAPGGLAAWLHGFPLLVHEQNRAPGLTNRILAKLAKRVLCGFPATFSRGSVIVTGNPVRADIAAIPAPQQRFINRTGPLRLLVIGGSQGAQVLNQTVPQALAALAGTEIIDVWHQSGEKLYAATQQAYREAGVQARIEPFVQDMAQAYTWADIVICRAGASTLAELCAAGIGSVLVPFALAVDDHQTRNAQYLCEHGAAYLLTQDENLATRLHQVLSELATNPKQRLQLAVAARQLALPKAAAHIADIILEEAR